MEVVRIMLLNVLASTRRSVSFVPVLKLLDNYCSIYLFINFCYVASSTLVASRHRQPSARNTPS